MTSRCTACRKPVIWAELGYAKPIVLDAKPEKRFTLRDRQDDPEATPVDTYQKHKCAAKTKTKAPA